MTPNLPRPLHRLTPLRDDPAAAWLSQRQRVRVALTRWFAWSAYSFLWFACWLAALSLFRLGFLMTSVYCCTGVLAVAWPVRRVVMRRCSAKVAELVRDSSPAASVAIDDFADLDRQPDGTLVSLVGWIRAREQLPDPVDGEPCIGLALACHQRYPGVMETLNDFDLIDEAGRAVLVQVADGRMLGASNVNLTDGKSRMLLVASLDLPVGAVATGWDTFVLRNGDPVMTVGFKRTVLDPTQASVRAPAARSTVASSPTKPLLVFPIPGERQLQPPVLLNLS
jgi:hypothetical protein